MEQWYKLMTVGEQFGLGETVSPRLVDELAAAFGEPVPVERQGYPERPEPVLGWCNAVERRGDELWALVHHSEASPPPNGFAFRVAYISKPVERRRITWLFPAGAPL